MSDSKYPSQLAERFQIRMPEGLRDRIRERAEQNHRSMNAEIIALLEFAMEDQASLAEAYNLPTEGPRYKLVEAVASEIGRMQSVLVQLSKDLADPHSPLTKKSRAVRLDDE